MGHKPLNPEEARVANASCTGCVPASEWHWFRWVLMAQPVLGVTLYLIF